MSVLVKIIILLFSFIIGLNHVDYGNGICSVISFSLCLYVFLNLRKQYKYYVGNNWHYSLTNNYSLFDNNNRYNSNTYYYNSSSTNKTTIKFLEKKIKKKKHNFIEFCDEPKFLVKKEECKDMTINNSNPKKPKLDLTNVLNKVETNEKRNKKLDGSEVIMVINDDKIDNIKKTVYDVIIKTLDKYKLSPNERYALLQSFYYIDICPLSVVIYIDKFILEKAHLNESHLHADELVDKIRDVLYCPNMDVTFVDLKCINLLNFYLKK